MLQVDIGNAHSLFIGIKHLKVAGGRAKRCKYGIEGECIGTKAKVAFAKLLFTAIAKQHYNGRKGKHKKKSE